MTNYDDNKQADETFSALKMTVKIKARLYSIFDMWSKVDDDSKLPSTMKVSDLSDLNSDIY